MFWWLISHSVSKEYQKPDKGCYLIISVKVAFHQTTTQKQDNGHATHYLAQEIKYIITLEIILAFSQTSRFYTDNSILLII